jgi:hypothetical protein
MRRILLPSILFLGISLYALDVEVEQVLDAPPSKFGTFYDDSAAYASNGELLFMSRLAFNLFVLKNGEWKPLIEHYRTEEYNHTQEQKRRRGYNDLFNSTIPDEFVYFLSQRPLPAENYRVFVDENGKLQAEWVSQEYYDLHLAKDPKLGRMLGRGLSLRNGYKVTRPAMKDMGEGHAVLPEIVGPDGKVIFRFADNFREGFVEDTLTIAVNSDRDHVAMVISFRPEKDSLYYVGSRPWLKKLVIFKISYNSDSGSAEGVKTQELPCSGTK